MTLNLILPTVNGSSGVWGTMLNTALTQVQTDVNANTDKNTGQDTDITSLKTRVSDLEKKPASAGMLLLATSTTRPPAAVGQIVLETDTGYLYYVQTVSGVPTRLPWPGSYLAKLKQTSAQTFSTGTSVGVTMDTKDFDRLGGWNGTSRYTAQVRGVYEFTGAVSFSANAVGYRACYWSIDGAAHNSSRATMDPVQQSGVTTVVVARNITVALNVGQYVELVAYQNATGTNLTADVTTIHQPAMTVKYLGYNGS